MKDIFHFTSYDQRLKLPSNPMMVLKIFFKIYDVLLFFCAINHFSTKRKNKCIYFVSYSPNFWCDILWIILKANIKQKEKMEGMVLVVILRQILKEKFSRWVRRSVNINKIVFALLIDKNVEFNNTILKAV